jgi:hypothetical protein
MTEATHVYHNTESSNFLRAYEGETLNADEFLVTGRRVVLISHYRAPLHVAQRATIALPPVRQWLHRDITIVEIRPFGGGNGYLLRPAEGDGLHGNPTGNSTVRLLPLLSDRDGEPDAWAVVA